MQRLNSLEGFASWRHIIGICIHALSKSPQQINSSTYHRPRKEHFHLSDLWGQSTFDSWGLIFCFKGSCCLSGYCNITQPLAGFLLRFWTMGVWNVFSFLLLLIRIRHAGWKQHRDPLAVGFLYTFLCSLSWCTLIKMSWVFFMSAFSASFAMFVELMQINLTAWPAVAHLLL